jgi:hypothetical protein
MDKVEPSPEVLARFHALVLETFGFNLEAGREDTLKLALNQRMASLGLNSCEAYHAALVASRPEADRLAELLPIGGYLIVGATETLHHDLGILALVERNGLFVFRKQAEFSLGDRRAARRESGSPSREPRLAALALDPLILEACLMLGIIARNEGDNPVAQQRFREAIYLDGACWMAHFYLAEMLGHKDESRRARSGDEAVLRILGDGGQHDQWLFPLVYKAEPFLAISRHKLALLQKNG